MPLVTSKKILEQARKERFGVGAFNANNLEMVQAIIEAAEEERAPVILQVSQGTIIYAGLEFAARLIKTAAELSSMPVVLHLDHGTNFQLNVKCLREGFTSLMYDGTEKLLKEYKERTGDTNPSFDIIYENIQSRAAFEDNVRMTKMVADLAHSCDVPVEAELGKIPRVDEYRALIKDDFDYSSPLPEPVQLMVEKLYAQPEMAEEFVRLTGCDSLAVACGSVHGMKSDIQPLNLEHLDRISSRIDTPLVLHGSSGVIKSRKDARERGIGLEKNEGGIEDALDYGVTKINVSTEIQLTFINGVKQAFDQYPGEKDIRKLFLPAKKAMKEKVKSLIRLFRSSGKGVTGIESKLTEGNITHS